MPVESAADLASFFNDDEFAITGAFPDLSGAPTIKGIFDADPVIVGDLRGSGVQSSRPVLRVNTVSLPTGQSLEGQRLNLTNPPAGFATAFRVASPIETDGTGVTLLSLEEIKNA